MSTRNRRAVKANSLGLTPLPWWKIVLVILILLVAAGYVGFLVWIAP